jgi:protein-tyrosine phosphatase
MKERAFSRGDPSLVKLLFVCTGNICRSPTADGILRARIRAAGLEDRVSCDSAGMHGYHAGEPPDPRSIATARQFGVEIGDLRARRVVPADLDAFDIVAVMENAHLRGLQSLRPSPQKPRAEIRLLPSWLGESGEVPDPYYDDRSFVPVYRLIERSVDALFAEVTAGLKAAS